MLLTSSLAVLPYDQQINSGIMEFYSLVSFSHDTFSKNKKLLCIFMKSVSYSVFFYSIFSFIILYYIYSFINIYYIYYIIFVPFDVHDPCGSVMFCGTLGHVMVPVLFMLSSDCWLSFTATNASFRHSVYIKK